MLRFHFPLIEPDVRISRIRLSDKVVTLSPTWDFAGAHKGDVNHFLTAGNSSAQHAPRGFYDSSWPNFIIFPARARTRIFFALHALCAGLPTPHTRRPQVSSPAPVSLIQHRASSILFSAT